MPHVSCYPSDGPAGAAHGTPKEPADLSQHQALVCSTVPGDERWHFSRAQGLTEAVAVSVAVSGPLRSNNLSALLSVARAGLGMAVLPRDVAHGSVVSAALQPLLERWQLPAQEVHAVFPWPKMLPSKVRSLCDFLAPRSVAEWWVSWPH